MLYIFRHIISDSSVASCEGSEKLSVTVSQAYCCAVEFELAAECERVSDTFCGALSESFDFCNVVSVSEGEHRVFVRELLELLPAVTSYLLCRGVCSYEVRVLSLNGFQLLEKHVELIVAHSRHILDVVPSAGLVENVPELFCPDICLCLFHNANNLQIYEIIFTSAIWLHNVLRG